MDLCLYRISLVAQDKIYWHLTGSLIHPYWDLLQVLKHRWKCPDTHSKCFCCFCDLHTSCQFLDTCPAAQTHQGHHPWSPEYFAAFLLHLCFCQSSNNIPGERRHIPDSIFLKEEALSEAFWGFVSSFYPPPYLLGIKIPPTPLCLDQMPSLQALSIFSLLKDLCLEGHYYIDRATNFCDAKSRSNTLLYSKTSHHWLYNLKVSTKELGRDIHTFG